MLAMMDVARGGRAVRWRCLRDPGDIRVFKIAVNEDDREWASARRYCRPVLVPLLERVREVVQQPFPTLERVREVVRQPFPTLESAFGAEI
jgi:hypothetical protein